MSGSSFGYISISSSTDVRTVDEGLASRIGNHLLEHFSEAYVDLTI